MDRTANVTRTLAASALKRGTSRFATIWKECLFLITVGSGMSAYREYCTKSLAMVFRSRITKKVHESYFNDMSYYHIANLPGRRAIRDADERLASEVRSVSSRLTNVCCVVVCVFKFLYSMEYIYIYDIYTEVYLLYTGACVYLQVPILHIHLHIYVHLISRAPLYFNRRCTKSIARTTPPLLLLFVFSSVLR